MTHLLMNPANLVLIAFMRGYITLDESVSKDTMDVAVEVVTDWSDRWTEGEGFGSSDHTYLMKDFLEQIGKRCAFIDFKLTVI